MHVYEVRPRRNRRGVDLISDAPPFGRLWYDRPNAITNAMSYATFLATHMMALIRVCNEGGKVIETHEYKGDFKECS